MVKSLVKYPHYAPASLRPAASGAFFDFAAQVSRRHAAKLESYSLARRKLAPAGS